MPNAVGSSSAVHGRHRASSGVLGHSARATRAHSIRANTIRFTPRMVPQRAGAHKPHGTVPFGHIARCATLVIEVGVTTRAKRTTRPGPTDAISSKRMASEKKSVVVLSQHAM